MHFLSCIPNLRRCLDTLSDAGTLEKSLWNALYAILHSHRPPLVHALFNEIKDFNGRDNRYGQIAVPDFLDYLCTQVSKVGQALLFRYFTRLQCSKCKWMSEVPSDDYSFKLYIPKDFKNMTLANLVGYNSRTVLRGNNAVCCGNCRNLKTKHTSTRVCDPDILMVEIIRVTKVKQRWIKNNVSISFSCSGLSLPGFSRTYRVVSSCNHHGSIISGHWFTKVLTERGWFELNDLKSTNSLTHPPGSSDTSVVVLLLIAEDKLL